jgi:hypothetical protein
MRAAMGAKAIAPSKIMHTNKNSSCIAYSRRCRFTFRSLDAGDDAGLSYLLKCQGGIHRSKQRRISGNF